MLCLLGEQHVVSGGVSSGSLSMPVAVVFAGWMMGGGQIAWQMQNDE